MQAETGFLLSYIKYGDHDAVIHCFTKENGYRSLFLRGIYAKKSKKKPYLFPLRELRLTFKIPSSQKMPEIAKLELAENRSFDRNVVAGAVLFFIADFLNLLLKNEEENAELYGEITKFLSELQENNFAAHLIFLIRMLKFQGITPLLTSYPYLNPESGSFEEHLSHQLFGEEISGIFKKVLQLEDPYALRIRHVHRTVLAEAVMVYCQYHITDFRIPKSLDVVQHIFD